MKKSISVILVVWLILSFATIANAACSLHGTRYEKCNKIETKFINNGSSGHTKQVTYFYECELCAEVKPAQNWTDTTTTPLSHSFSTTDLGHLSNTYIHKWKDSCAACGYSNVRQVSCTSCVSLNAIIDLPE